MKEVNDAELDRMTARECFEYLSRGLEGGEAAILKAVAMTRAHERRKAMKEVKGSHGEAEIQTKEHVPAGPVRIGVSPSARLAVDWLLTRIGSWTNARWDQHLRDHVGDVATDRIIEDLGYEKMPAGEAPRFRP